MGRSVGASPGAKILLDRRGGLITIVSFASHGAHDDGIERGVDGCRHFVARRIDDGALQGGDCFDVASAGKRRNGGGHFVKHHAQAEDVDGAIDRRAAKGFGGHVGEFALEFAGGRLRHALRGFGDAEIEKHRVAGIGQEHIGERNVAMNDLEGLTGECFCFVRGVERGSGFCADPRDEPIGESVAAFLSIAEESRERIAADVVEDDEVVGAFGAYVDRGDDVGMANGGGDVGFVVQHVDEGFIAGEMWVNAFDRDGFDEPTWPDKPSDEDFAHPAGGKAFEDLVATESLGDILGIGRHACR